MAEKSERAQREEKILKFWKDNDIFSKTLDKSKGGKEFVFYDGPPFATGLPHYGHILPGTIKDVIPRYKTMQGYMVPRRWGWDCHGLPIENLVEKELGLNSKKDIEKFGIAEFNKRARESVLRFEKEWKEIIPRTGRFVDMDYAYKTMDSSYTESVWWSFKKLFEDKLIYKGFKPMHLCPHCETTLSNFEVNQGYKDITDISIVAKFELVDEPKTYFLAWTTTPWTLPGNVALAIKKDASYAKVKKGEESFIVLKDLVGKVFKDGFEQTDVISGKKLIGTKYKALFNYYQSEGQVYGADFVNTEEGTGIVHIAPAFGEDDYELSIKNKLPLVQHVGMDGRFKPEVTDFAGEQVKPKDDHQATDIKIIKYLAGKNLLFGKEKIIHSYPHCWRCDTPLINYAASSWFLSVTNLKKKLVKNNLKTKWVPEDIRDGRFGKWLEGAKDWAISRSRFWGTPVPLWQNPDATRHVAVDSLETIRKYSKRSGNKYWVMRHGGTECNKQDISSFKNQENDHLTEEGREQVLSSVKKLKNIDLIVTSTFVRTRETAEIVCKTLGLPESAVISDARLIELNAGEFDERAWHEYHEYMSRVGPDWFYKGPPGGESALEVSKRVGACLYELEEKYQNKNILIITHGGPAWLLFVTSGFHMPDQKKYGGSNGNVFVEDFKRFSNAEVRELPFVPLPHNEDFQLDLHRPYIDDTVLVKDGEEYRRILEVFDTWYDSGSVPFASRSANDFAPADFIAEGLDQTRGWFYTMMVLGTALFGKSPYKQVVVNGLILAEDGKKMSKRLNNYPELTDVLDKYGADALRYYLVSSGAVRAEDLAFSEKGLDEVVKKIINRIDNCLSFYELYANEKDNTKNLEENVLDRWIDTRLAQLITETTNSLERYELDKASRPINDFIDDLSTWYLRRSRTRPEALSKLSEVLLTLSKIMAPFMPFMAEDIYRRLGGEKESVHLEEWPKAGKIDEKVIDRMREARAIVTLGLEARSKANIKVRQPLTELIFKIQDLGEEYLELIKDEVNVKEITDKNIEGVELNTQLTDELIEEGKVRDVIRAIQEWRKEKGLKPGEKALYETSDEFILKHREEIEKITNIELPHIHN